MRRRRSIRSSCWLPVPEPVELMLIELAVTLPLAPLASPDDHGVAGMDAVNACGDGLAHFGSGGSADLDRVPSPLVT